MAAAKRLTQRQLAVAADSIRIRHLLDAEPAPDSDGIGTDSGDTLTGESGDHIKQEEAL